jgi:hypothetical protein
LTAATRRAHAAMKCSAPTSLTLVACWYAASSASAASSVRRRHVERVGAIGAAAELAVVEVVEERRGDVASSFACEMIAGAGQRPAALRG